MVGCLTDTFEVAGLSTEPSASRADPRRRLTENDVLSNRVVVVSPYTQFNRWFEQTIPNIVEGTEVDVVTDVEMPREPYLRVSKREVHQQRPRLVIDFGVLRSTERRQGFPPRQRIYNDLLESAKSAYNLVERGMMNTSEPFASHEQFDTYAADILATMSDALRSEFAGRRNLSARAFAQSRDVPVSVPFDGYRQWAEKSGVTLLVPNHRMAESIAHQASDDVLHGARFDNPDPLPSQHHMRDDLIAVLTKARGRLYVFETLNH